MRKNRNHATQVKSEPQVNYRKGTTGDDVTRERCVRCGRDATMLQ